MNCPKCGDKNGKHFVPPSLGESGFYTCECEVITKPTANTNSMLAIVLAYDAAREESAAEIAELTAKLQVAEAAFEEVQQARYIDGYRTGREHNYSNNAKLIDHLEEETTRLQAEVARLKETVSQDVCLCVHCNDVLDANEDNCCVACDLRASQLATIMGLKKEVARLTREKAKSSELWLAQTAALGDASTRIAELEAGLRELDAMVREECPFLFNEDFGGNAGLDMRLAALLNETNNQQRGSDARDETKTSVGVGVGMSETYCPRCLKQYHHPLPLNHGHTCIPHPAAERIAELESDNAAWKAGAEERTKQLESVCAKLQAAEADNAKHLEAVDHYRSRAQELEDFLRRIYACEDATCAQCAAEIEAHLSIEDGSSRELEGVVEAPLVDGPRRVAVGTDQGDADNYFNEWKFAHQVAEERADRIDRLQAEVARLKEQNKLWQANEHDAIECYSEAVAEWPKIKKDATEAALRWAWSNLMSTVRSPDDFIKDGLAALLGEVEK